ncbi:zinc finger CCHC domain-containing protein 8 [Myripristis murdjan]|uniref:Zinc finger CCHC domain-containing protein 8 n=1 Tax=Myripristis murdjan TaxID=586833 RepID=A0A668ANI2_9TELE|nr:zinc finger CCHC domain-containing protein 8 [Myripristis murdjan]
MAEVDFGDSELFEQLDDTAPVPTHIRFTDEEEGAEDGSQLKDRLEECEDNIQRLLEENKGLKRKLNIITRPSGIRVEDVNIDGPLLQILYTNNVISKQCRQEIEDSVCGIIQRHQAPGNQKNNASFRMTPQNSAFLMEEDQHAESSSGINTKTEAFSVVGSVLYFTTFSIDKLGQPLLNETPQLTEGWEVPTYQQVFSQVIGTDGQEIDIKDKRPRSICFNCGSSTHQLRDCPEPKDMAAINERRKEFTQSTNQTNQRYHADEVEERFTKYKPGVMSEELLTALGAGSNTLSPVIYRMRLLGYPPGWLKEAEMEHSGLTLYDGKVSNNGDASGDAGEQKISYDVSKLVDFPGFNVPAPHYVKDEYVHYCSVPMQYNHMKPNFAAYLSNNFPLPGATSGKRRHESDSTTQQRKKRRSSPERGSDMEVDSDSGAPCHYDSSRGFQFQPPLPPGSPSFSSPPPLPQGTPPATPTPPPLPKGTPPLTPNGSPALQGRTWVVVDDAGEGMEDGLTLEELEEQQRLIWAALENADTATNSDCETPAMGTPAPSSPSVSTPAHVDTETEMEDREADEVTDTKGFDETICQNSENQRRPEVGEDSPQSPGPVKAKEDSPQSPGPIKAVEDSPQTPGPIKAVEDSPQSPGPAKAVEDSPQSPGPVNAVEDSPQSPGPAKAVEDSPQSPGPVKAVEDSPQSPGPVKAVEDSPQSPNPEPSSENAEGDNKLQSVEKISAVPHRSKFAAGIVPFEDTPEFTEVAEATGTYLKIRDLLKKSPRNLAKVKNKDLLS